MSKLLHIQCSPRGQRSASIAVATEFLQAYQASHPDDQIETLDLWATSLPEFDGETLNAKYAVLGGESHTAAERQAWDAVVQLTEHFKSADKYLISLPMWNFSMPYKLKHYIDLIAQPGLTFSYTPEEGYKGLVTGKPIVAVYARGGAYGPGTGAEAYDQQSTYLKQVLGFIGFTGIQEIFVEPTLAGPDAKQGAIASASMLAAKLASDF
ncbi:NAD(P)H-dependent oxidoreductase [Luteolibacter pohnpeiensis]|uniref:FMN dependent NADH:quinone oxidoreductase n=1 Tax=Luteolibacter pohnpeiensis TaxID=454153 RepID=A0A934S9K4_9BACT|nr:NAD(P)H-dependent oxidoreductase [Luteolibacter pohnpeiensis]MBK1881313.1 NAD(P)H-dependent oxidoreductase [Luteolibacter pohnpeiensis]